MLFTDEIIENLSTNPIKALEEIINIYDKYNNALEENQRASSYNNYLDSFAALESFLIANDLGKAIKIPTLSEDKKENINSISYFFYKAKLEQEKLNSKNVLFNSRSRYSNKFGNSFAYKFSDGDVEEIRDLIRQLNENINSSAFLEENHKMRLLKRLEELEIELNKKMTNLDKYWGLVGDAGIVMGKFGKAAEPIIQIIRQITVKIWAVQSYAEELPSGTNMPLLKGPKDES